MPLVDFQIHKTLEGTRQKGFLLQPNMPGILEQAYRTSSLRIVVLVTDLFDYPQNDFEFNRAKMVGSDSRHEAAEKEEGITDFVRSWSGKADVVWRCTPSHVQQTGKGPYFKPYRFQPDEIPFFLFRRFVDVLAKHPLIRFLDEKWTVLNRALISAGVGRSYHSYHDRTQLDPEFVKAIDTDNIVLEWGVNKLLTNNMLLRDAIAWQLMTRQDAFVDFVPTGHFFEHQRLLLEEGEFYLGRRKIQKQKRYRYNIIGTNAAEVAVGSVGSQEQMCLASFLAELCSLAIPDLCREWTAKGLPFRLFQGNLNPGETIIR